MKLLVNAGRGLWLGLGVLAVLLGLCGCQSTPPPTFPPEPGAASASPGAPGDSVLGTNILSLSSDRLAPGNRINIIFSGIPNPPEPHIEQIRSDGFIKPPLLNQDVLAAGKTTGQLQEELHSLYVPSYFKSITVTVRNEERYFFVGGDVRTPGQIPYRSEMTVLKAIQAAGDFTDFARRSKVQVTRSDGTKLIVNCDRALRDPKLDLPIYPGDSVYVPRRIF